MNYTKLNVGSRDSIKKSPEWLNIDIDNGVSAPNFMCVNALDMPMEWDNHFKEVQAVHVLEHINRNYRVNFCEAMYRVLAPEGVCYIEVPDFRETIRLLEEAFRHEDHDKIHIWTTSIYGKQRSPGDQHCWGYTATTLKSHMQLAGFKEIEAYRSVFASDKDKMISSHWKAEPVLLVKGVK